MMANWDMSFDALTKRFEDLKSRKITAEANLQHANDQLQTLKQEAREQFGTDDLEALQQKLLGMEQANEQMRSSYEQHLTQIEQNLADVETRFKDGATP